MFECFFETVLLILSFQIIYCVFITDITTFILILLQNLEVRIWLMHNSILYK